MQIRFPRKLRLGFCPLYGLTVRQLIYLAAFTVCGGIVMLAGPVSGMSILVRAVIGIALVCAGLGLAFFRIGGLALDTWLPIVVRYLTRPRKRVWRKRTVARPNDSPPASQRHHEPAPRVSPAPAAPPLMPALAPAVQPVAQTATLPRSALVLLDVFILGALFGLTWYLQRGGWLQVVQFAAQRLAH